MIALKVKSDSYDPPLCSDLSPDSSGSSGYVWSFHNHGEAGHENAINPSEMLKAVVATEIDSWKIEVLPSKIVV